MFTTLLVSLILASPGDRDYNAAYKKAVQEHKDLLVKVGGSVASLGDPLRVPKNLDLDQYVICRVGKDWIKRFRDLEGKSGVVLVFLSDEKSSWFGRVYHVYDDKGKTRSPEPKTKEALDEVNATRAARGLYPYVYDEGLTVAAKRLALTRATYLIEGHLANDFAAVPPGSYARSTGCAAWPPHLGWGSCCQYDTQFRYAGAAWHMGRDGRRYMHLVVR